VRGKICGVNPRNLSSLFSSPLPSWVKIASFAHLLSFYKSGRVGGTGIGIAELP